MYGIFNILIGVAVSARQVFGTLSNDFVVKDFGLLATGVDISIQKSSKYILAEILHLCPETVWGRFKNKHASGWNIKWEYLQTTLHEIQWDITAAVDAVSRKKWRIKNGSWRCWGSHYCSKWKYFQSHFSQLSRIFKQLIESLFVETVIAEWWLFRVHNECGDGRESKYEEHQFQFPLCRIRWRYKQPTHYFNS